MASKEKETTRTVEVPAELQSLSFEDALEQLESTVEAMEEGSIPLQELVEAYEKGTHLLAVCQKRLDDAELRVAQLRPGEDRPQPLDLTDLDR